MQAKQGKKSRNKMHFWVHYGWLLGLCCAIAVITYISFSGSFLWHLRLSLVFGISADLVARTLAYFKPHYSRLVVQACATAMSLLVGLGHLLYSLNVEYPELSLASTAVPVLTLGLLFNVIVSLYFVTKARNANNQLALEQAQRRQTQLDKALTISRLNQLQSQMNPHFLFNTLANVDALIDANPQQAKHMLQQLNTMLRAVLKTSDKPLVPLAEELALNQAYLAIHKIRLGKRLEYDIQCQLTPALLQTVMLPPFLLQPLVENAIIHGIQPNALGGQIRVQVSQQVIDTEHWLSLQVTDNGNGLDNNLNTGLDKPYSNGIGLSNIKQRLAHQLPNAASFQLMQTQGKHTQQPKTVATLLLSMNKLSDLQQVAQKEPRTAEPPPVSSLSLSQSVPTTKGFADE